jgi:hypothetical protein
MPQLSDVQTVAAKETTKYPMWLARLPISKAIQTKDLIQLLFPALQPNSNSNNNNNNQ